MKKHRIMICICLFAHFLVAQDLKDIQEDGDIIEIVDYKQNLVVGYMVFKNGRITKKVLFKQSLEFQDNSARQIESKAKESAPKASRYEQQLSHTPSDSKNVKNADSTAKKVAVKKSKQAIQNEDIPQEVGAESQQTNDIYKEREWNKKKIPYEMETKIIDIQQ